MMVVTIFVPSSDMRNAEHESKPPRKPKSPEARRKDAQLELQKLQTDRIHCNQGDQTRSDRVYMIASCRINIICFWCCLFFDLNSIDEIDVCNLVE